MSLSYEITSKGLEFKDSADILQNVRDAFLLAFPNLDVYSTSTPQGQLILALTEELVKVQNQAGELVSAIFRGGSGSFLDIWAATFFSIQRQKATPMIVTLNCKGSPNTTIPADFKAQTSDNKFIFKNISGAVTIPNTGEISISMQSEDLGDNQILENTLTKILTPIIGLEIINNPTISTKGNNQESDDNLYKRCIASFANRAVVVFESMLSAVKNVPGVLKCSGYDNDTENEVTFKGVVMPPHSVSLFVKGGDNQLIGEAMLKTKNPGCYTSGQIEVAFPIEQSQQEYVMRFSRPSEITINFNIKIKLNQFSNYNYDTIIKNSILSILDNQEIGSDLFPLMINNELEVPANVQILEFTAYKASESPDTASTNKIVLNFNELAVTTMSNIIIEVVEGDIAVVNGGGNRYQ